MGEQLNTQPMDVTRFGELVREATDKLDIEGLTPIARQIITEDMEQLCLAHPEVHREYMEQLERDQQDHLALLDQ